MSGAGADWASPANPEPSVRVITTQMGGAPGALPPGRHSQERADGEGLYVWIVMALLIASTALALYDLYLLASVLGGA